MHTLVDTGSAWRTVVGQSKGRLETLLRASKFPNKTPVWRSDCHCSCLASVPSSQLLPQQCCEGKIYCVHARQIR